MTNNTPDIGLFEAARDGDLEKMAEMLDLGADINAASGACFDKTALMIAVENNQAGAVKFLISRGAGLNAVDLGGGTAYAAALSGDHQALAEELSRAGADTGLKAGTPAQDRLAALKPGSFQKIFEVYGRALGSRKLSGSVAIPQITLYLSSGAPLTGVIAGLNFEKSMLTLAAGSVSGPGLSMFVPFGCISAVTLRDLDLCPEFLGALYNLS